MCHTLSAFRGLKTSSNKNYALYATEIMSLVHTQ